MPGLLFKWKPTPVQHHLQVCESTTPENPPLITGLFCVFQRSHFPSALQKRDSTALTTDFPLLFKLIFNFERAILSSYKHWPGMLLLQCTSCLLSTSSVQVHIQSNEYFTRYRRAISGTLDMTAKDDLFQQPRKHQKHLKKSILS